LTEKIRRMIGARKLQQDFKASQRNTGKGSTKKKKTNGAETCTKKKGKGLKKTVGVELLGVGTNRGGKKSRS